MQRAVSRLQGRYYVGIAVLSCVTLAYQIIITRFFSVILYYHFAFAAISLAMLGLTRGAMAVFAKPERYATGKVPAEFAHHAAWFAASGVAVVAALLLAPLVVPAQALTSVLPLMAIAFIVPFTHSGICITLLLTRLPYGGGWLYAADLCGAALGCVAVIFALFLIDPVSAVLWIGALAAGAGWIVAGVGGEPRRPGFNAALVTVLSIAAAAQTGLAASGHGHLGVFWAKGEIQSGTLFERWNTYSRVRVAGLPDGPPFGWGFAHAQQGKTEQAYLDIDADAATVLTRTNGDIAKLTYLQDDVINSAYLVQRPRDVAIVGVGGGRDVLSALYFGAKKITGIEINPAIFEVLTDKFADFSGHLDRQPGVSLVNAEARSYINHSPDRHDLIQISLIDTWAATAAGGLTLTENRLYTVEAWDDFYRALNPGGILSVSRWYDAKVHRGEFYRLIAIAGSALQRAGVAPAELSRHVVALNVGNIVTVITRPDAFTDAEWQAARGRLEGQGFGIMLGPDIAFDATTSTLLSGKADAAFFASLSQNLEPSTDDKPFFFYRTRLKDFVTSPATALRDTGVSTTVLMVIATLIACIYYIGFPFARMARQIPLATLTPPVAYFSAIGIGFMLIEISQMQRLMVFLGHPVYGLAVVLFTLLLFSGLGSLTVGAEPRRGSTTMRITALVVSLLASGLLTPFAAEFARTATTELRVVISVLLLSVPAFFMGMMFPLGLGIWKRHTALLPFFWSANGIASTFASVLGMALSIQFGIANTFALGALIYVVCAVMVMWERRSAHEVPVVPSTGRDQAAARLRKISRLPEPATASLGEGPVIAH